MNAEELRSLQSPLKALYRDEPGAALSTLTARGTLGPGKLTCDVETVRGLVAAGLHPATGGDGSGACRCRCECECENPAYKFMGPLGRSDCYRCSTCGRLLRLRD